MRTRTLVAALALVCILTGTTVVLVVAIERATGQESHDFLIWNLFLAWLPLVFALALEWRRRRGLGGVPAILLGAAWLLFLPNAPYLVTDFVHLGRHSEGLWVWLDLATLTAGATAGALAGLLSLLLVQRTVSERLGPRFGWALVMVTLALASFGIYLGRVLRLNSWDLFARPRLLAGELGERLGDPLGDPRMIGGVIAVAVALGGAYLVFYRLAAALEARGAQRQKV
jgi:uncharacterized membrane protein